MKYIKYFEKNQTDKNIYKVGEIVIYENEPFEILKIQDFKGLPNTKYRYYYNLKSLYGDYIKSMIPNCVFKLATKEELLKIEMTLKTKKYNL